MEIAGRNSLTSITIQSESADRASRLMKPIDLVNLIARSLFQKEGAWVPFTHIHELPARVTDQIVDIQCALRHPLAA